MLSWLEATSLYKVDDKQFLNKSLEKILVAIPERKTHSWQNNSYSLRYFLSKQIVTQGNIVMELSFLLGNFICYSHNLPSNFRRKLKSLPDLSEMQLCLPWEGKHSLT